MQYMGLNEIREKYLSFFESKGHLRLESFPLVPQNDKSILLINAGMTPLKPYFTGQQKPPRTRVTTCQKCIRTPDIERVGHTSRHGTFFEMLGNFSFGDYFKREATAWAWEFVTKVMQLPVDKIYVTVYQDDDEAYDIWTKEVGVDPSHVSRLGKEDNFWEHGEGPCGPCSEIYFDRGVERGCGKPGCAPGCDCDRFVEFWNLVFTQFNNDGKGNYTRLEKCNIDTGMGLERLACIMQGVDSLFDVDTIKNITARLSELSAKKYGESHETDVSLRVVTDHIRSTTFMVCDGVLPSNEGRGYVLRRLLRRAARHGKLLGIKSEHFLSELVDVVVRESGTAYPELIEKADYIKKIIDLEETRFNQTLDSGLGILSDITGKAKAEGKTVIDGADAFRLYDTFGFPIEFTEELAKENGLKVDVEGFKAAFEEHQKKSQAGAEQRFKGGLADTSLETARLHSATHLLQAALRKVLNDSTISQRGSNITAERLRFDFSFGRKLTKEELQQVEDLVNQWIQAKAPITCEEMTVDEAKEQGAVGLFGDKYGERVKVYTMGDYSCEICGGPHAANTGDLGTFKIKKEEASSAGVRRIKAVLIPKEEKKD